MIVEEFVTGHMLGFNRADMRRKPMVKVLKVYITMKTTTPTVI